MSDSASVSSDSGRDARKVAYSDPEWSCVSLVEPSSA